MLALLCSGQGTQHPDMFRLTGTHAAADELFRAAQIELGEDPRIFVKRASGEELFANVAAQILCTTQAVAAHASLANILPAQFVVAGYSVGEVSAWGVAGMLKGADIIRISHKRASLMDAGSGPHDGLAYSRGLSLDTVRRLAAENDVDIAIINPGDMVVVGGEKLRLDAFCAAAISAGASRARPLGVHVASHTSHLSSVIPAFRTVLEDAVPTRPRAGVVMMSALNATPMFTQPAAIDALSKEIGQTLHWADCLQALYERGVRIFLELGPGRALADMVSGSYPDCSARSIDDFRSIDGIAAWLAGRS